MYLFREAGLFLCLCPPLLGMGTVHPIAACDRLNYRR